MNATRWGILIIALFNIGIGGILHIVGNILKSVAGYFPIIYNTYQALAFGDACVLLAYYSLLIGFITLGALFVDEVKIKTKQK